MTNRNTNDDRTVNEQILDLLLDALLERQAARRAQARGARPASMASAPARAEPSKTQQRESKPGGAGQVVSAPRAKPVRQEKQRDKPQPGDKDWQPPPRVSTIGLQRTVGRLLLFVAVLAVLVNVPVTRYGVSLARILPDSASLIIRNGLVLKGSGPEIYMLEDDKLRWISSLDAFEHLGLKWEQVHIVEDSMLEQFDMGEPYHVLLKCEHSPHIYRAEGGVKRWIKDIATFEAEGHVWEQVQFVSCEYLDSIPDGPPIPEDAGLPPRP